jgi:hypothetical protein
MNLRGIFAPESIFYAMRLGQLARKLNLSPTDLINYLASNGIEAVEGPNTRLNDDQISLVAKQFNPDGKIEIAPTVVEEIAPAAPAPVVEEIAVNVKLEIPTEEPIVADEVSTEEPDQLEKSEVIKAPKVELAGLKVLGKIELPEPKKKEPIAATEENPEAEPVKSERASHPERRKNFNRPERRNNSSGKNPIALQREREANEAERKKQEQLRIEKERRTQYYMQRVKSSGPTKPARIIDEPVDEIKSERTKTPTTWLGRFWRWYRS